MFQAFKSARNHCAVVVKKTTTTKKILQLWSSIEPDKMHTKQLRAGHRWLFGVFKINNMHLRAFEKKKNCAEKAPLLTMKMVGINQEENLDEQTKSLMAAEDCSLFQHCW